MMGWYVVAVLAIYANVAIIWVYSAWSRRRGDERRDS